MTDDWLVHLRRWLRDSHSWLIITDRLGKVVEERQELLPVVIETSWLIVAGLSILELVLTTCKLLEVL